MADFEEEDSSGDGVSDEESIDGEVEKTNFVEMGLLKKSLKLSLNHQVSKIIRSNFLLFTHQLSQVENLVYDVVTNALIELLQEE